MIKVLIVDDHSIVRMGMVRLLADVADIEVVAEAESGEDAIDLVRKKLPDIVLLDVKMPGIGGLETTKRLLHAHPGVKIIMLTTVNSNPFPARFLQAGAVGYLTKECGLEEIVIAIHKVIAGHRYIKTDIAEQLALNSLSDATKARSSFESLSERELQIMLMITSGLTVAEISENLCISSKTVNTYRYRLFEKLNLKNDVELTHFAIRHGIIEHDENIKV